MRIAGVAGIAGKTMEMLVVFIIYTFIFRARLASSGQDLDARCLCKFPHREKLLICPMLSSQRVSAQLAVEWTGGRDVPDDISRKRNHCHPGTRRTPDSCYAADLQVAAGAHITAHFSHSCFNCNCWQWFHQKNGKKLTLGNFKIYFILLYWDSPLE